CGQRGAPAQLWAATEGRSRLRSGRRGRVARGRPRRRDGQRRTGHRVLLGRAPAARARAPHSRSGARRRRRAARAAGGTLSELTVSVSPSFRTFILEQLNRIAPRVRGRSMFGGVGIYAGDLFFALITYNLVQLFGELGQEPVVYRNDALTVEEVLALKPRAAVLSPGPRTPGDAGILVPLVKALAGKIPVLGVCLGHQAIGEAFGGRVVRADRLMHGKTC